MIIMDKAPLVGGFIKDIWELDVEQLYKKDRKFTKAGQDMFDTVLDRLDNGRHVFLLGVEKE